jgi:periplasmic copper chaperone A
VSTTRRLVLALLLALSLPAPLLADGAGGVTVGAAWAPPSLAGAQTAVAYFKLVYPAGPPERWLSASTPVAKKAELHRHDMKDGVMSMGPAGPLALQAGDTVMLSPGGLHLMLLGLKQPLKTGDRFPVTLTFEHQAALTVEVAVQAAAPH